MLFLQKRRNFASILISTVFAPCILGYFLFCFKKASNNASPYCDWADEDGYRITRKNGGLKNCRNRGSSSSHKLNVRGRIQSRRACDLLPGLPGRLTLRHTVLGLLLIGAPDGVHLDQNGVLVGLELFWRHSNKIHFNESPFSFFSEARAISCLF